MDGWMDGWMKSTPQLGQYDLKESNDQHHGHVCLLSSCMKKEHNRSYALLRGRSIDHYRVFL